jgi:predicted N-formylglutamate amidohydrolase
VRILFSCEHGGNRVPRRYREQFRNAARELESHLGWDPGALVIAHELARRFDAPLFACTATRLLVDPNRSNPHPRLFSRWTRALPEEELERIVASWWHPHRAAVEDAVRASTRRGGRALHVSVHTFTPVWAGTSRKVDVGILYDPARRREKSLAGAWLAALAARRPDLSLRRNQPYRGTADGLTAILRQKLPGARYLGIELEVSQRFPAGRPAAWRRLRAEIAESLEAALGGLREHRGAGGRALDRRVRQPPPSFDPRRSSRPVQLR